MNGLSPYGKKLATTLLLSLFVYILIEKAGHGHPSGIPSGSVNDHTVMHAGISCLVCDFQLPAADVVPGEFSLGIIPPFRITLTGSLPCMYFDPALSPFSERGPPSVC